jgi:Holliday junction resolvasome RuvABC endonuclease subunit
MTIKTLEKKLAKSVKKDITVLGLDTASRTGWCKITIDKKNVKFDYGFIDIDTKNRYFKYNEIIDFLYKLIQPGYKVIVEDTFYRFNPAMFRLISRIGAIAYTLAYLDGCSPRYMLATTARKNLGIKGNCKKEEVSQYLKDKFGLNIKDNDIGDAIVLALCGVLEDESKR